MAAILQCGKQMEKLPHYYFSWIVSFQKQRYVCEVLPLETNNLEVNYSPIWIWGGSVSRRNIQQQALPKNSTATRFQRGM
jgi:hypothetical protein